MKKIVAAILCVAVLLFTACSTSYEKQPIKTVLTPYVMPEAQPTWVTLYYPSQDKTHVLAFTQQLEYEGSLYYGIMDALLSGTNEGYVSPFPQGVSVRSIMLVQDILYIDMSWQFAQMEPEALFQCISVLIATFTGFSEISFINITVEGRQLTMPGLNDHPIMLLSAYTGTIAENLTKHQNLITAAANGENLLQTFYGAIYFADETNKYIVPKAVSITIKDGNYASALISTTLAQSTAIFPGGFMLVNAPEYNNESSQLSIELICPAEWQAPEGWLGPYALMCALNSIYPDARRLLLTANDSQGNQTYFLDSDTSLYYEKIRSGINVLTPNSNGTGLANTTMLVSNMPTDGNKDFLNEFICMINPEFRVYESVVNDVIINNDTTIIDLSAVYFNYYNSLPQPLSGGEEYALVYSLITTACTFSGTSKALLLQDGQLRSTFAGNIKTDIPLLTLPSEYISSVK